MKNATTTKTKTVRLSAAVQTIPAQTSAQLWGQIRSTAATSTSHSIAQNSLFAALYAAGWRSAIFSEETDGIKNPNSKENREELRKHIALGYFEGRENNILTKEEKELLALDHRAYNAEKAAAKDFDAPAKARRNIVNTAINRMTNTFIEKFKLYSDGRDLDALPEAERAKKEKALEVKRAKAKKDRTAQQRKAVLNGAKSKELLAAFITSVQKAEKPTYPVAVVIKHCAELAKIFKVKVEEAAGDEE